MLKLKGSILRGINVNVSFTVINVLFKIFTFLLCPICAEEFFSSNKLIYDIKHLCLMVSIAILRNSPKMKFGHMNKYSNKGSQPNHNDGGLRKINQSIKGATSLHLKGKMRKYKFSVTACLYSRILNIHMTSAGSYTP